MKKKIFCVVLLAILLLSACAPVVKVGDITGKNAMNLIYDDTFATVKGAWVLSGWILGIALGIALGILQYNKFEGGIGGFIGVLLACMLLLTGGSYLLGNSFAKNDATNAIQVGADKAKTRKANQYKEKLHIPLVKTELDVRNCYESDGGTGCKYSWSYDYNFHEECTPVTHTDSEGNTTTTEDCEMKHDTRYVPYFTQEWRTLAYFSMSDDYLLNKVGEDSGTGLTKSDIKDTPYRVYTDWQAPENYQAYLYGNSHQNGTQPDPMPSFTYAIPGEWKAMDQALKSGQPYVLTVWHDYVNWVFAADHNNLVTTSSQIDKYLKAGVLPQINYVYSKYGTQDTKLQGDYDFVQFNGLNISAADNQAWQNTASLMALNVGPTLQGSMIMWFVPAESIDNPDAWITAAKAYLSDRDKWGLYMAPKNMILIGCGVDQASNTIKFCRMETGMPSGNATIKYTIDHVQDVPFTPQGVFGTLSPSIAVDKNGFYTSTLDTPSDGFMRLLFAGGDNGFTRIRMQSMDWLKTDVKLDAPDIQWAVDSSSAKARQITMWLNIVCIVIACAIAGITLADNE
jgi:hypothetical protein